MQYLFPIAFTVVVAILIYSRLHNPGKRSDYLRSGDQKFLAQATNAALREKEISRLTRTRKYSSIVGIGLFLVFTLRVLQSGMDSHVLFLFIMGVLNLVMFHNAQTQLRFLLFVEETRREHSET